MAPRDLALSRPSPRGKKNSRGAPRLRQIESRYSSLTQVRRVVIERVRLVSNWRVLGSTDKIPANKRDSQRTPGPGRLSARFRAFPREREPGQ